MSGDTHLGEPVHDWRAPPFPDFEHLQGRYAEIQLLDADAHAADIHRANTADDSIWTYLPYGPFASAASYHRWMRDITSDADPRFYAIKSRETGHFGGVASYLRIAPDVGSIEMGHINLARELQGTRVATEALYLLIQWAFEAGYRRFEWKCNSLNVASRRAAQRLGLSYEGVFRQATISKGRNRDTAWFAAIDKEWPALKEAFEAWLRPENFDASGQQVERLSDLTRLVRLGSDPTL